MMRDHRPQPANDFFNNTRFKDLQEKAIIISKLSRVLKDSLPAGCEDHCRVANYRQGSLVIEVSSSVWSTRINYERLAILSAFRQHGLPGLSNLEIKINPDLARSFVGEKPTIYKTEKQAKRELSAAAASALEMVAETASPKLKKRLESLAALANKK
ncbi:MULTISPECIES: DUF721 domain-containing protein [unclassified Aliivibrio]|jgi:hypothetical protein|uniref:DUF721 domain-containing protein n=1 Tax=unclassified Aliivibrio TaxID=2645654 RepID=UPI000A849077|nr:MULTISPECIES: DciA family protein [unclassified Aliivibrio]